MCKRKVKKERLDNIYKERTNEVFKACEEVAMKTYNKSFNALEDKLKNMIYVQVGF